MRRASLAAALAIASACACAAPAEKRYELAVVDGRVPAAARLLRVEKGDAVRLRITSNAAGELHLHGYRLEAKVGPGVSAEIAFTAHATGRYPLEWHAAGDRSPRSHHGPPLAALEVRPK